MAVPLLALAKILTAAPAVFEAGASVYRAVTGKPRAPETPEDLAEAIAALPPPEQGQVLAAMLEARVRHDELATRRFEAMAAGDADKLRASARPQIAMQAMASVDLFVRAFSAFLVLLAIDWAARLLVVAFGSNPQWPSPGSLLAQIEPVWELFGALIVGGFWASVSIVRTYMGVRERDKAQEYEIMAGHPLQATQASITAAGGAIAQIAKALKK